MLNEAKIKELAQDLQIDACAVVEATAVSDLYQGLFNEWLERGAHGGMSYMERYLDKRINPQHLLPEGAKTLVLTLYSYHTHSSQYAMQVGIARYAHGLDYHRVMKKKLQQLYFALKEIQPSLKSRVFVDTAPIHERYWATQAGLGWIGKNGMLINKRLGSYTFIGVLLLNEDVKKTLPQKTQSYCGSCNRCVDACPTNAILEDGLIDARKCFAYHTIEAHICSKKPSENVMPSSAKYVFGCDICQEVCPWNKKAVIVEHQEMQPLPVFSELNPRSWITMQEDEFDEKFANSPILRAGLAGMKKNVSLLSKINY
ncbi:MAG: tRNA epoxyqueuosine(34) reductase QueG [Bacteroidales bacterium]